MTTAHRPTFDPARGKEAARGEAYHQRLLPAHKILKFRQATQGAPDEQARRDLKAELLKAERAHYAKKEGRALPEDDAEEDDDRIAAIEAPHASMKRKADAVDDDISGDSHNTGADDDPNEDYEAKKRRVLEETRDIDADSVSSSSSSESEDDDEEDETAELMRELAKIKAERAEASAKAAAEQAAKDQEQREKDIALGNPLLNARRESGEYGVKRRWDDDVIFKNQARGTEDKGKDKRFVNDLLRSDFHRKFMVSECTVHL